MSEIMKETVSAQGKVIQRIVHLIPDKNIIYFLFWIIEIPLAFRLIFKSMIASQSNSFVSFIYGLTGIFILPFEGISRMGLVQNLEATSVLEPSVLTAITVYALLAWGIVKLVRVLSREQQEPKI